MAIKKYIGARYAPQFMGAWDKASEYAALSVVYTNDQSYVSRKTVPANTEITNTEFWIKSADWNAQVTQYNQNVERYQANVERYNQNVETYNANVDNFFDATIHAYNTKEEMVNDTTIQPEYTLITCGANSVGDGGGSLYKVANTTSATAVALKNGLFAVPFDFTLESDVGYFTGVKDTTTFVTGKRVNVLTIGNEQTNFNVNFPFLSETDSAVIEITAQNEFTLTVTAPSFSFPAVAKFGAGQFTVSLSGTTSLGVKSISIMSTPAAINLAASLSAFINKYTDLDTVTAQIVDINANATIEIPWITPISGKIYIVRNGNQSDNVQLTITGEENSTSASINIEGGATYLLFVSEKRVAETTNNAVDIKALKFS